MKRIMNIDEQLNDINEELLSEAELAKRPRYRQNLIAACGLIATSDPNEAIALFDIGLKIKNSQQTLMLENAEYEKLKNCVEKNPTRLPSVFFSQMIKKVRSAEDVEQKPAMEVK